LAEARGDKEASIWEHLEELAVRLRRIIIALAISAAVLSLIPSGRGEFFYAPLVTRLPTLIFQHVVPPFVEAFDGRVYRVLPLPSSSFESISILALAIFLLGFIGASPVIAREIWGYIEPALYPHEKAFAKRYVTLFLLSFLFGVFFGIYIVAPLIELMMLKLWPLYIPEQYKTGPAMLVATPNYSNSSQPGIVVLVEFLPLGVAMLKALPGVHAPTPTPAAKMAAIPISVSINEVVSFALKLGLAFGALFELPIVLYLLLAYGILDPDLFTTNTMKYIFLATMILGAVISPDPSGIGMLVIGFSLYLPLHVAIKLGKKRALKRQVVSHAEARAATSH